MRIPILIYIVFEYFSKIAVCIIRVLTRVTGYGGDEHDENGDDERHGHDGDRHRVPVV